MQIIANVNPGGGNNANGAATDAVRLTVVQLTLAEIDYNGPNNVGITINGTQDIGVPAGAPGGGTGDIEWVKGLRDQPNVPNRPWVSTQAAPAAFIKGAPIAATVYFTVAPAGILSRITIAATGNGTPYGDIGATTLSLNGGLFTGTVQTTASDPNVDVNNVTFNWSLSTVTTGGGQAVALPETIEKTTNRIYTLYAAPAGPLASEPWASVLELAIGIVKQAGALGANAGDDSRIVAQLTTGIYKSLWMKLGTSAYFINPTAKLLYDPDDSRTDITGPGGSAAAGGAGYVSQEYDLTDFLSSLSAGAVTTQQCNDNSDLLAILADSIGIGVAPWWFAQSWPLYQTSPLSAYLPPTTYYGAGDPNQSTSTFTFHQVDTYLGSVYDPSTGPIAKGKGNPTTSTSFDAYLSGYAPTVYPLGGVWTRKPPITQSVSKITVK